MMRQSCVTNTANLHAWLHPRSSTVKSMKYSLFVRETCEILCLSAGNFTRVGRYLVVKNVVMLSLLVLSMFCARIEPMKHALLVSGLYECLDGATTDG